MTDTDRIIEPLFGPYAGQHLAVSASEAETALHGGWARDPYNPAPPRDFTFEEREAMTAAAARAVRRWRGEERPDELADDPSEGAQDNDAGAEAGVEEEVSEAEAVSEEGRDMVAAERGKYQTRAVAPAETTRRGRPPTRSR